MLSESLPYSFKIQGATLKQCEKNQLTQWADNGPMQLWDTAAAYFLTGYYCSKWDILSWDGPEISCGSGG